MYTVAIASITPNGIAFNNHYYTCKRAIKERWFSCPQTNGKIITILYRPEDISTIIIGDTEKGDVCRLVNKIHFDEKKLMEYYEALDCLKIARKKYRKVSYKYLWKEF